MSSCISNSEITLATKYNSGISDPNYSMHQWGIKPQSLTIWLSITLSNSPLHLAVITVLFKWCLYILQASCYFANQGTSYIDCL